MLKQIVFLHPTLIWLKSFMTVVLIFCFRSSAGSLWGSIFASLLSTYDFQLTGASVPQSRAGYLTELAQRVEFQPHPLP